jgi:DNA-binding transcriptional LysR family regulator
MDFLQLEYFLEVAKKGNMSSVADAMNVSQSSVSRSIARLEDQLGVSLFDRVGRGIELNEFGRIFYNRADNIMREFHDGEREIGDLREQMKGRLSIATNAARQINHLVAEFVEEHPEVLLRQKRLTDMTQVKAQLDSGTLDLALSFEPIPGGEYEWKPVLEEDYYIVLGANALPDENLQKVPLTFLEGKHLFCNDSDDPDKIEHVCREKGLDVQIHFVTNEYEMIGPMVSKGLGAAICTTHEIYDIRNFLPLRELGKLCALKIDDEGLKRTLGIIIRKDHYMSPVVKEFYRKIEKYLMQVQADMKDRDL